LLFFFDIIPHRKVKCNPNFPCRKKNFVGITKKAFSPVLNKVAWPLRRVEIATYVDKFDRSFDEISIPHRFLEVNEFLEHLFV